MNTQLLINGLVSSTKLILDGNYLPEKMLEIIGISTNSNKVSLFENNYENGNLKSFDWISEWCNKDAKPFINNDQLKNTEWETVEALKATLITNNIYPIHAIKTNNEAPKLLFFQNFQHSLYVPIFSNSIFWGFIGILDCENQKHWSELSINTITAIAENWGTYILKNNTENSLKEAQNKIVEQNDFYSNILNKIPIDFVVFNTENEYVFINENTISDNEIREWLIGKTDFDYCKHRSKPINIAIERTIKLNAVKKSLVALTFEENFELPNGMVKTHMRVLHPIIGNNNTIELIVGFGIDISEMKQKDQLILKLQNVIEKSPVGVALLNKEGQYYYMNKSHSDFFHYEQNELLGKSWKTIYGPTEIENIEKKHFPLLTKNGNWKGETIGITKTGENVVQEIVLSAFEDGELACLSLDLTQTREELNKFRITNENLELALKASNLGMWILNFSTLRFDLNSITRDILNISNDENEGTFTFNNWIKLIHPEDRKTVLKAVKKHLTNYLLDNSDIYSVEYRVIQKNGSCKWVLGVGRITGLNNEGKPESMTGFLLDINLQKLADESIKQNEARYRDVVESLKEVFFKLNLDGNIEFLNKSWTKTTGFSIDFSLNKNIMKFVHSDDKILFVKKINLLITEKITSMNEKYKFFGINDQIIWFNFSASIQKDEQGNAIAILGSAENITEKMEAEMALIKNKEILDKVASSIDDVICTIDIINNKILYISSSCKKMTGFSDDDFYNNKIDFSELVCKEHLDLYHQSTNDLVNNKTLYNEIDYRIEVGDNKTIKWIRDKKSLILDELGNPVRIDGVKLDITKIVMAEVQMAKSEEKYRLISENIQDVITILDAKGNCFYVSPSAIKNTGYTEDYFLSNKLTTMVHPDDIERVKNFLISEILPNGINKIIFKYILADSNVISVESVINYLESNDEKVLILASSRDITLQVAAELSLKKSLEKEKNLGEMKTRFVNMTSHEFRTPLSIVKSSTQLIQMYLDKNEGEIISENNKDKIIQKTNNILFEIDRITALMTDVLTLGKMEANKIKANLHPINLNEFMVDYLTFDAINFLNKREVFYSATSCDNCIVNIDTKLFSQVLQNGLSNAIKYSPIESVIEIKMDCNEQYLKLVIKDAGIGIPADEIANIFDSYFRSSIVENIPGTGIGMSIIKMFVELNAGTVAIESKLGEGTSLIINLPVFRA
ncbi:MAG: PAS domain-containing sensor histidine kinase [Bacteroidia bacterium]